MSRTLKILALTFALCAVLTGIASLPGRHVLAQVRAALTRDVDNPARLAIQHSLYSGGSAVNYTVPVGKTLVIEDVEYSSVFNTPGTFGVVTTVHGLSLTHYFAPGGYVNDGLPTGGSWYGGRTTRLYADGGTTVFIQTSGSAALGTLHFSGYLIDTAM